MDASAGKQCPPGGGATTQTTKWGNKPLYRFLRAEPKSVGIVMMFMGSCMFIFGIPMRKDMSLEIQADIYSSFWLGILYFICGLLYIQSEREPTKKIITASFALSTLSIIASAIAAISFIITMTFTNEFHYFDPSYYSDGYNTSLYLDSVKKHFLPIYSLEVVFLSYSLIGIVILITMTIFGRMALRSTRTQAVVVMRNIPATG